MKILAGFFIVIVLGWLVITTSMPRPPHARPCTNEWLSYIDRNYFDVSDGHGHGPDLGSSEWLGSVEEMAGLPVKERVPNEQRCQLIQSQFERHTYIINQQLSWFISF
ncbi:hypothetical protein FAZ69_24130 [Trinickia terrae]|uniref:Uncharacterized protein n=1 Tax=Trinickia terrae TaxID=2571161 RepID=A0A4U1HQ78_9BURK|nr:hypothetical protein [Trinickia terrae]TKC83575.1 hypothetical protein FAZ69_24130 [Trinickia terrae]